MKIRRGRLRDLQSLMRLEASCFEKARRASEPSLRHSLISPHQEVWFIDFQAETPAALVLRLHPHTCRILSIAVDPEWRGQGLGSQLLGAAIKRARHHGCHRIHLEADSRNPSLLAWYELHGFRRTAKLNHHYAPRWHAWHMRLLV